ncbi:hypothetical protein [Achromobacter anxifer]|uniref:hypothetical protein n=1 Tax=Achromobacter anxifer TaxID=1287737 RepID=UPI0023F71F0C|nr:hypothetical protein [Achromobacter anxifer]MDF8364530.1 hypothetical protein [Achromobacter anxifer]
MNKLTGDDLLWNWARWTWSGETVGNMETYISEEEDYRPINHHHAMVVDEMHAALPWHERMIIIAEYPQKNVKFGQLGARARRERALDWIADTTGIALTDTEYKLYLGLFRGLVERRLA